MTTCCLVSYDSSGHRANDMTAMTAFDVFCNGGTLYLTKFTLTICQRECSSRDGDAVICYVTLGPHKPTECCFKRLQLVLLTPQLLMNLHWYVTVAT